MQPIMWIAQLMKSLLYDAKFVTKLHQMLVQNCSYERKNRIESHYLRSVNPNFPVKIKFCYKTQALFT